MRNKNQSIKLLSVFLIVILCFVMNSCNKLSRKAVEWEHFENSKSELISSLIDINELSDEWKWNNIGKLEFNYSPSEENDYHTEKAMLVASGSFRNNELSFIHQIDVFNINDIDILMNIMRTRKDEESLNSNYFVSTIIEPTEVEISNAYYHCLHRKTKEANFESTSCSIYIVKSNELEYVNITFDRNIDNSTLYEIIDQILLLK